MIDRFIELSINGEKSYRLFLDVIKKSLDRAGYGNISAVQALLLFHLKDNPMSITELMSRGYYTGSNASYNMKKLISGEFLCQVKSDFDHRSNTVKITDKGRDVCDKLESCLDEFYNNLRDDKKKIISNLDEGMECLLRVERIWKGMLRESC